VRLAIGGKPDYLQIQGERFKVHAFSVAYSQRRNVRGNLVQVVQVSIQATEGEDHLEMETLF